MLLGAADAVRGVTSIALEELRFILEVTGDCPASFPAPQDQASEGMHAATAPCRSPGPAPPYPTCVAM